MDNFDFPFDYVYRWAYDGKKTIMEHKKVDKNYDGPIFDVETNNPLKRPNKGDLIWNIGIYDKNSKNGE